MIPNLRKTPCPMVREGLESTKAAAVTAYEVEIRTDVHVNGISQPALAVGG